MRRASSCSIIVIHNFAVLGLFALENITMAEMFGSRNRFTRMAISKRRVVWWRLLWSGTGGDLLQYDRLLVADCRHAGGVLRDWLVSAILMPEVRDRDLSGGRRGEAPRHGSVGYGALSYAADGLYLEVPVTQLFAVTPHGQKLI
jgi:MHS family metabolite:H+ symporter-like MFS transporter